MEVEVVMAAVKKNSATAPRAVADAPHANNWRPNPHEPRLMLEREVLKARLQMPALMHKWKDVEKNAFSHPAYIKLREFIDTQREFEQVNLEAVESDELKSFITELTVEPIRTDGEISDRYVSSITARLNEVALSRSIAEVKSTLQRLNPVENEVEYNQIFGELVGMETKRRALRELALGEGLT
jgi:DNA primase